MATKKTTKPKTDDYTREDEVSKMLHCPITEKEKAKAASRLAECIETGKALEEERKATMKDYTARKERLIEQIGILSRSVKSGEELRPVPCTLTLNFSKQTADLVRNDTGKLVESRPLTPEEIEDGATAILPFPD